MDKKLTIKESFNLGKGWNLMIFAILAMLVTNAPSPMKSSTIG